ncbi:MAG: PAS domain S-box protein, partial [Bacteroidota bacterium]
MEKKTNGLTKPWFLIAIFILLTILFLPAGHYYFQRLRTEMKSEQYKLLSAIASFKVNEITNWLSERKAEGLFFSNSPDFILMLKKLETTPASEELRQNIRLWLTPVKKNHDYSDIRVYDENGSLMISVNNDIPEDQEKYDRELLKTLPGTEIVFTDLKMDNSSGKMFMDMVVPIDKGRKNVGFVLFIIDPGYFLFPLIQKYPVQRNSAVNMLAQQKEDSLLLIGAVEEPPAMVKKGTPWVPRDTVLKSFPQEGAPYLVETKDHRDVDVIADVRPIPGSHWNLISSIELQEISAPLRKRAFNIILYILTILAVIGIALILNWKNQQLQNIRSKLHLQDQANKAFEKITFMNALLGEVNDAIITFDKDMMIQSWNKGAERIYGWKADEVIGKFGGGSLRVDFHGLSRAEAYHEIEKTGTWKGEVVHKRKDGSTAYLLSSSSQLRDAEGNVLGIIAINKDISEVVQSEKIKNAVYRISELAHAARDLDEMYMAIHVVIGELMDARNMYIALLEPDGKIISFPYFVDEKDSHPPAKKWGRGLTEYVLKTGKPLLARPEDTQYFIDREIIEMSGTPAIDWLGIPLRNEKETFGVLVVQSYSQQVRYGEHEKDMLTFVSEQIALSIQRKKMQKELVDARQKAEVSSKLTSALLANMNHELRTPMNGILGFAEILMNELSDPDLKMKAENILSSGRRLMDTLDAIMDLSYLESDNISRKFKSVSVAQVIHSIVRNYEQVILRKQIHYEQSVPQELTVLGDEHLFHHM